MDVHIVLESSSDDSCTEQEDPLRLDQDLLPSCNEEPIIPVVTKDPLSPVPVLPPKDVVKKPASVRRGHGVSMIYKCAPCGKHFITKNGLDSHRRKCKSIQHNRAEHQPLPPVVLPPPAPTLPFPCEACEKTFQLRPQLLEHMRERHRDSYECCGLIFATSAALEYHKSTHSDESSYNETPQREQPMDIVQLDPVIEIPSSPDVTILEDDDSLENSGGGQNQNIPGSSEQVIQNPSSSELTILKCEGYFNDSDQQNQNNPSFDDQDQVTDYPSSPELTIVKHEDFFEISGQSQNIICSEDQAETEIPDSPQLFIAEPDDFFDDGGSQFGPDENVPCSETAADVPLESVHQLQQSASPEKSKTLRIGHKKHSCSLCAKWFISSKNLNSHLTRVHQRTGKRFSCGTCNRLFYTKYDRKIHSLTRVKCTYCDATFCTRDALQTHTTTVHQGPMLETIQKNQKEKDSRTCRFCSRVYKSVESLRSHVKTVHSSGKKIQCEHCDTRFYTVPERNLHYTIHHDVEEEKIFPCPFCQLVLSSKQSLRSHIARFHFEQQKNNEFPCPVCDKKFKTDFHRSKHALTHGIKNPFKCSLCNWSFPTATHLKNHVKLRHPKGETRKFACLVCDQGFHTEFALKQHSLIHAEELPHKCSLCKAGFKEKWDLRLHQKQIHLRDKEHDCRICKKPFSNSNCLARHTMIYGGKCQEKPFKCSVCPVRCRLKYNLKTHEARIHGINHWKS